VPYRSTEKMYERWRRTDLLLAEQFFGLAHPGFAFHVTRPGADRIIQMEQADLQRWVDRYVQAWATNDPAEIGGIFSHDATYYTAPFREPWRGRDGIIEEWLRRKDEPGHWEFHYEVMAATDGLGFVRGWTRYLNPAVEYSNLWVIRLEADGLCSEFTEWFMEHDRSASNA
jgi:hypothetical protein